MMARADVPGEDPQESAGLNVLDLVKHAARTIISTLDENDRLGIVTFGTTARVIMELTPMASSNKDVAQARIEQIHPIDATNLWHGILEGVKVFQQGGQSSRVPAMMVLTDGMPNHMCPSAGYVPKLRNMSPLPASIHTFGFGYGLRSGLLKSIAEIGDGNYAFIPDAGMIGTVFVHAVANLQSTCATNGVLRLEYRSSLDIQEAMGSTVDQNKPETNGDFKRLTINLGSLQYGQSRDIILRVKSSSDSDPHDEKDTSSIYARLSYEVPGLPGQVDGGRDIVSFDDIRAPAAQCSLLETTDLPESEIAYHESRTRICSFLSSLFPMATLQEHVALGPAKMRPKKQELADLIRDIPAQNFPDEALNQSLMDDLAGDEPKGQIQLAINSATYFRKWGLHYLPSLLNAYTRQICNSFKDSGPLQYGANSPLFIACRDRLDTAFDSLPAPTPSLPPRGANGGSTTPSARGPISMSRYHQSFGPCFAGSTPVELASGKSVAIRSLRRGVLVRTPSGPRKVALVLRTPVERETLCRVGGGGGDGDGGSSTGLLVTPWHPISDDSKRWAFPAYMADRPVRYTGAVYSILLQRGADPEAHAIRVGGYWGVTLGHGIVASDVVDDVRAHEFLGDFGRVTRALLKLGVSKKGIVVGGGVERDPETGMVNGFKSRVC